jgi:hypothetical protein
MAEQYRFVERCAVRDGFIHFEIRVEGPVRQLEEDAPAAHQHQPCARVAECPNGGIVTALFGLPVDHIAGKADQLAGLACGRIEERECHRCSMLNRKQQVSCSAKSGASKREAQF